VKRTPEIVLVLVTAIWGATFPVTRMAIQTTGPYTVVFLRFAIGAILVGSLVRRTPSAQEVKSALWVALAMAVAIGCQTIGLRTVEGGRAAFITALYVPLVPVLQVLITRRRPAPEVFVGAAMAFLGLALLACDGGMALQFGTGEALILVGALASAVQILLIGRFATEGDARMSTAIQLAGVAILTLGGASAEGMRTTATGLACVGFLGILGTAGAILAMNWAQKTVSPAKATLIYALEPVWAAVFGVLAGERLGTWSAAGGGLVIVGALLGELTPARIALRGRRA